MQGRRKRIRKAVVVAAFTALVTLAAVLTVMSTTAQAANEKNPQPNLSGTWKLDPARSDDPQMMTGGPGHGGPPEGGRPGKPGGGRGPGGRGGEGERDGGPGGPPPDGKSGPPHGMMRLPDRIALVQWPTGIEMRDSTGVAIQRVLIGANGEVVPVDSAGVAQFSGEWKGQKLEAQSQGPRGGTLTETFEIIDGGKALKITTHMQPPRDGPAFDISCVFARVSG